jgi:hypothetical protein
MKQTSGITNKFAVCKERKIQEINAKEKQIINFRPSANCHCPLTQKKI